MPPAVSVISPDRRRPGDGTTSFSPIAKAVLRTLDVFVTTSTHAKAVGT